MSGYGGKLPVRVTWLLGPEIAKNRLSRFSNIPATTIPQASLFPYFVPTAKLLLMAEGTNRKSSAIVSGAGSLEMWSRNLLTKRLNLEWLILQAPMGDVSTPALAAAVSNAGGLGGITANDGR
jgi:hypothetical protein